MEEIGHRFGYVALLGRPNVGKSTLFNRLAGAKLAAVTPKPQTTRNRLSAIRTAPDYQMVLLDTPGFHTATSLMNTRMVESALKAAQAADVWVLIADAETGIVEADRAFARRLSEKLSARPGQIVALNKIDRVGRAALPVLLEQAASLWEGAEIVPFSALSGENVGRLEDLLVSMLPQGPALYPEDQLSEQNERFWAQEVIREKLMAATRQELPYEIAVLVDSYRDEPERNLVVISATVLVSRPSQKAIVIGEGGRQLKQVGSLARRELEAQLGRRVFLELYVKVQKHWNRDPRILDELGV